jgi:hypothetical protein
VSNFFDFGQNPSPPPGLVEEVVASKRPWFSAGQRRPLESNPNSASRWFWRGVSLIPIRWTFADDRRERMIIMTANFDTGPDPTDVVDLAWAEMDEFFKALGARGPAATPEQWEQDRARFAEIQQRCNYSLVSEICEQAESSDPRPH